MIIGIDASNIRAGGGVTHLVEVLGAVNPHTHGFDRVFVWANLATLAQLEERGWLRKEHDSLLERSLPYRIYWQRYKRAKLATAVGRDIVFVPGVSNPSGFQPVVTMSRNLLPFEWREMRRYGFSWLTLKNLLLHVIQTRTFRRTDGLIFLTQYAQKCPKCGDEICCQAQRNTLCYSSRSSSAFFLRTATTSPQNPRLYN